MRIGGIDLGKRRIALSTFEVKGGEIDLLDVTEVDLRPTVRGKELRLLAETAGATALSFKWDRAWIEEPLVGRSVSASMSLSETKGAVEMILGEMLDVHTVNVRVWKLVTVGDGGAGKDQIRTYVDENHHDYALRCDSQDAYDAVCIGLYGALLSATIGPEVLHGARP